MYVEREVREEMNKLSKELFGSSSRWQKILEKGVSQVVMRTVKESVPGENGAPDTIQETQVPVLTESGGKQTKVVYHTVESLKALMLDLKAQRDAYLADMHQKQADAMAKRAQQELASKIQSESGGSAI